MRTVLPSAWIYWIIIGTGAGRVIASMLLYHRRRRRAVRRFARLRRTRAYHQIEQINPLFIEWIEGLALFNARSRYARPLSIAFGAALVAVGIVGLLRS